MRARSHPSSGQAVVLRKPQNGYGRGVRQGAEHVDRKTETSRAPQYQEGATGEQEINQADDRKGNEDHEEADWTEHGSAEPGLRRDVRVSQGAQGTAERCAPRS